MTIRFQCPHCEQRIEATAAFIGTAVTCPTCNTDFNVSWRNVLRTSLTKLIAGSVAAVRARRFVVLVAIASVFLVLLLIGWRARSASATERYWNGLQQVWADTKKMPRLDQTLLPAKRFPELAAQWHASSEAQSDIARKLRSLPPFSVDPALTDLILRYAATYDTASTLDKDGEMIAQSLQTYSERHESAGAFIEALIRGAAGDSPMNQFYESQADARSIQEAQYLFMTRGRELHETMLQMRLELDRIRVRLEQEGKIPH